MDEYIKREDAFQAITDIAGKAPTRSAYEAVWKSARALKKIPAADVVPVVHGHWIWHEEAFEYECSACHCRFDYNHMFELFDHGFQYANYCPNCGAKMDESKCEGVQHNG